LAVAGAYEGLRLALGWKAGGLSLTRAFGTMRSGLMTEDYVIWLLRRLPEGVTEIYFHPSIDSDSRIREVPTPTHRTVTELLTLLSPRVRQVLREERIELLGVG
jgi:hypothetical protein